MPISSSDELWDSGTERSLITFSVSKSEPGSFRVTPPLKCHHCLAESLIRYVYRKRNISLNLSFGWRLWWIMFAFAYFDGQGSDVTLPNQSAVKQHSLRLSVVDFMRSVGNWRASDRKRSETYPFSQIANDTGRTFSDSLPLKAEVSFAKRRIIFKRNLICITKTAPLITLALQFQTPEWNSPLPFLCTSFSSKLNQLLSFFCKETRGLR